MIGKSFYRWLWQKVKSFYHFLVESFMMILFIVFMIFYCIFHFHSSKSTNELLQIASQENIDTYEDLYDTMRNYQRAISFEAYLLLINGAYLIKFMRISPTMNFVFATLYKVWKIFFFIAVFFTLTFLAYAVVATQIWSYYEIGYRDIPNAMVYLLLTYELRLNDEYHNLYARLSFPYERFFAFMFIFFIIMTVISIFISTAVVFKAFYLETKVLDASIEKEKSHYLKRWFFQTKIQELIYLCWKKDRSDVYNADEVEQPNAEMVRSITRRR